MAVAWLGLDATIPDGLRPHHRAAGHGWFGTFAELPAHSRRAVKPPRLRPTEAQIRGGATRPVPHLQTREWDRLRQGGRPFAGSIARRPCDVGSRPVLSGGRGGGIRVSL